MTWFVLALKKYATFSGRSRRKEYWMFLLFFLLIPSGLVIIDVLIGTHDEAVGAGLFQGLSIMAMVVPYLSVTARRLHDTGKSGWLQLLFLIPLLGPILQFIWMATEGDSVTPSTARTRSLLPDPCTEVRRWAEGSFLPPCPSSPHASRRPLSPV